MKKNNKNFMAGKQSGISIIKRLYKQGGKNISGENIDGNLYILDFRASGKPAWSNVKPSYKKNRHSALVYNNNIYFFGGYDTAAAAYCNDLWRFNMDDESFSEVITTGITI